MPELERYDPAEAARQWLDAAQRSPQRVMVMTTPWVGDEQARAEMYREMEQALFLERRREHIGSH